MKKAVTFQLTPEKHQELKIAAIKKGVTLKSLIEGPINKTLDTILKSVD